MKTSLNFAASLGLALAIAAPAQAQLLGGGLGGSIGLGGGLPLGGLDVGTAARVTGAVDGAAGSARGAFQVRQAVRVPATKIPAAPVPVVPVPAVPVQAAASLVAVPAIPDLAVRRTAIAALGIAPISVVEVPAYVDHQYVVLQNELRGTGVEVIRRNQQIVLEMPGDVTFAFDKSDIQPRFYPVLDAVSRTLSRYSASYVDVDGHTDAIGSYAYNQRLSERRADTVARYLSARNVNGARLHVQGFGKTEPIASNATVAGRAANRRVEIVLTPYAG